MLSCKLPAAATPANAAAPRYAAAYTDCARTDLPGQDAEVSKHSPGGPAADGPPLHKHIALAVGQAGCMAQRKPAKGALGGTRKPVVTGALVQPGSKTDTHPALRIRDERTEVQGRMLAGHAVQPSGACLARALRSPAVTATVVSRHPKQMAAHAPRAQQGSRPAGKELCRSVHTQQAGSKV